MDNIKSLKKLKKEDWLVLVPFGFSIFLFIVFALIFIYKSSNLPSGFNMWDLSAIFLFLAAIFMYLIPHHFFLEKNIKNELFLTDERQLDKTIKHNTSNADEENLKFFEKEK